MVHKKDGRSCFSARRQYHNMMIGSLQFAVVFDFLQLSHPDITVLILLVSS